QNSAEVASLLADDYTAVLANGRRVNKSAMLSLLENSADTFEYVIDDESLDVRVLSRTRAVVTGTARWKGTHKNGTSFYGALRFTSTWAERNGRWQLIVAVAADLE
ncbi:MAG: nuclear transport factor 2 family protein, partial [Chthoniobacterales bacterium]